MYSFMYSPVQLQNQIVPDHSHYSTKKPSQNDFVSSWVLVCVYVRERERQRKRGRGERRGMNCSHQWRRKWKGSFLSVDAGHHHRRERRIDLQTMEKGRLEGRQEAVRRKDPSAAWILEAGWEKVKFRMNIDGWRQAGSKGTTSLGLL